MITLWDTVFASEDRIVAVEYICLTMLAEIRTQLLAGDYTHNMGLLQVVICRIPMYCVGEEAYRYSAFEMSGLLICAVTPNFFLIH